MHATIGVHIRGAAFLLGRGNNITTFVQKEVASASNAIKVLQGGEATIVPVEAFGAAGQHTAVVVPKIGSVPQQYPRQAGKPNKHPL